MKRSTFVPAGRKEEKRKKERKKGDRIGLARLYARLVEFFSSRYDVPGTLRWLRSRVFSGVYTILCAPAVKHRDTARAWTRVTVGRRVRVCKPERRSVRVMWRGRSDLDEPSARASKSSHGKSPLFRGHTRFAGH